MNGRLRNEAGWTLPELLIAMVLMLIVMGATLSTLDIGNQNRRLVDLRTDATDEARTAMDNTVRQLRNLASPSATAPSAIDLAAPTDFSFRTFDPNKRLVRYCLETTSGGAAITNASTSLVQMLSNTDTPGSYTSCTLSTTGWSARRRVVGDVVNLRAPNTTDVFAYNGSPSNTSTITNVRMNILLDVNSAAKSPSQIRLATGAALRNQNQPPTGFFTVSNPSARRFILNGTSSFDPEGHNLSYKWYVDHSPAFAPSASNFLGNGPVLDITLSTTQYPPGTDYYFKLVVSDSNLSDTCPTSTGVKANCTSAGPITI